MNHVLNKHFDTLPLSNGSRMSSSEIDVHLAGRWAKLLGTDETTETHKVVRKLHRTPTLSSQNTGIGFTENSNNFSYIQTPAIRPRVGGLRKEKLATNSEDNPSLMPQFQADRSIETALQDPEFPFTWHSPPLRLDDYFSIAENNSS